MIGWRSTVQRMVSRRSSWSLTGRHVIFAPAAASGSRIISCLQPNDPPIGVLMARMWLIGMWKSVAMDERTPNVDCVGDQTVMRSVPGL